MVGSVGSRVRILHRNCLSWCKWRRIRTCSYLLKTDGNTEGKSNKSTDFEAELAVQPDLSSTVRSILQKSSAKKCILKAPSFSSQLLPSTYPDIGQSTPYTHPHYFESIEEVTPGISRNEFATRRYNLMKVLSNSRIGSAHDKHLVVLSATDMKIMTNDIPYPFHQDTDFLYLTGFQEPDALLAIDYNKINNTIKFLLFVTPKDPKRELWDGARAGQSIAKEYFNADESFPLSSFPTIIRERYGTSEHCLWYRRKNETNKKITSLVDSPLLSTQVLNDIGFNLHLLRLIKSPAEMNLMKKSASIAANAFVKVIKNTQHGLPESYLHALLTYECQLNGAQFLSFPPVVAGGNRANTLHYINNTQILRDGELVLMDGGCEYNGYSSDITRTWPVSGKFTPPQKELYEIVLKVQRVCLKACKPGVSLDHLHHVMLVNLGEELQDLGFISSNLPEMQLKKNASKFCPHHLGHYLGMDVHDTPLLHRGLPMQVGMVFTLEPGLYVPLDCADVPDKYRGIGIRVEDDILMTKSGPYVLTAELPKEVEDIEKLMQRKVM